MDQNNQLNQENYNQPQSFDDPLAKAKNHFEAVKQYNQEKIKQDLGRITEINQLTKKPGSYIGEVGQKELEAKVKELNMPGIYSKIKAKQELKLREQALQEQQNLIGQNKSWSSLPEEEKSEIADRVHWGATYQDYWDMIFTRAQIKGANFRSAPTNPAEKMVGKDLETMVGNELELALSRDPQNRDKAKDNALIDNLAEKIAADKNFISLVNQQAQGNRNIRLIRMDIERLLKENLTNDTAGNL